MPVRTFATVITIVLLAALTPVASAQRAEPLGVVIHDYSLGHTAPIIGVQSTRAGSWNQRGFWSWTGIGIIIGGIAGAIWGGVEIAKSDDPMLPALGLAIGTGAGALAGGLLGAFAYTITHPPTTETQQHFAPQR